MTFAINLDLSPKASYDGDTTFSSYSPLTQLLIIACCNNQAQYAVTTEDTDPHVPRRVLGDATDAGLLRFCDKVIDVDRARKAFTPVYNIPFNSRNKWALSMVTVPGDEEHYLLMLKGAPEYVVRRCTKHLHRGEEVDIDSDFLEDMNAAYQSFGLLAERVIGHAFKVISRARAPSPPDSQEAAQALGLLDDFVFSGLLSLIDPPRETVPAAVAHVRRAGVAVTMVTGDHPLTAEAIARKCGIVTGVTRREVAAQRGVEEGDVEIGDRDVRALIVTGDMLDALKTDDDWDEVMDKEELVFARTTPQQKLAIVTHFQRRGDVVALTGDGVNDAPALRRADIGVAMGNPDSSEVAREAADVVLLDDDFTALVEAVAEGRVLYDNLKKTIAYTMTHIPAETYAVILNLLLGMPLGLGAMLVLTIDLLSEQGPAGSLASEPAESNLMERPPRDSKHERLVNFALLNYCYFIAGSAESLCAIGAYLWTYSSHGVSASHIFWLNPKDSLWLYSADSIGGEVEIGGRVYTPEMQAHIARQANASWYIAIITCQWTHIWLCKSRRVSVFRHKGIFTNKHTWWGVCVAIAVMLICVYTPQLQNNLFYAAPPPVHCAFVPCLFFLAFMLPYTEVVKAHARKHPNSRFTKYFAW